MLKAGFRSTGYASLTSWASPDHDMLPENDDSEIQKTCFRENSETGHCGNTTKCDYVPQPHRS